MTVFNPLPRGTELGYAEITADFTATTAADVTGLTVTATVGSRPIVVVFNCFALDNGANNGALLAQILEGATGIAQVVAFNPAGSFVQRFPGVTASRRLAPSAGSHTYKVQLGNSGTTGTATIRAAATAPAFLQVIEV